MSNTKTNRRKTRSFKQSKKKENYQDTKREFGHLLQTLLAYLSSVWRPAAGTNYVVRPLPVYFRGNHSSWIIRSRLAEEPHPENVRRTRSLRPLLHFPVLKLCLTAVAAAWSFIFTDRRETGPSSHQTLKERNLLYLSLAVAYFSNCMKEKIPVSVNSSPLSVFLFGFGNKTLLSASLAC